MLKPPSGHHGRSVWLAIGEIFCPRLRALGLIDFRRRPGAIAEDDFANFDLWKNYLNYRQSTPIPVIHRAHPRHPPARPVDQPSHIMPAEVSRSEPHPDQRGAPPHWSRHYENASAPGVWRR
jgi:hypothetical protein